MNRIRNKILIVALLIMSLLVTMLPGTIFADVTIEGTPISNQKIKEAVYYDKNPDPNAPEGWEDYPAIWMLYEDPDGHDNTEVFILQEVASQKDADNKDLGYKGMKINGKWYKVIGLWTVNPEKDIIDKGNGEKAVFTPIYYSENNKPQEGSTVGIAIWDYDYVPAGSGEGTQKGGITEVVEIEVPGKGQQTKVVVEDTPCTHEYAYGREYADNKDGKTHSELCGKCHAVLESNQKHSLRTREIPASIKWPLGATETYCTQCEAVISTKTIIIDLGKANVTGLKSDPKHEYNKSEVESFGLEITNDAGTTALPEDTYNLSVESEAKDETAGWKYTFEFVEGKSTGENTGWVPAETCSAVVNCKTSDGSDLPEGVTKSETISWNKGTTRVYIPKEPVGYHAFPKSVTLEDGGEYTFTYYYFNNPSLYKADEGSQNQIWNGSGNLEFHFDVDYEKFRQIGVDGKELVDPKDATAKEGSTIITLNESYLKTLANGSHTLFVGFNDGYAEEEFTVRVASAPSDSDPVSYKPQIGKTEHGKVTTDPAYPVAGQKVTIAITADEGYELDKLTVTDDKGKPVDVTENEDGTWSYIQPAGQVTITATFKEKNPEPAEKLPFSDVTAKPGDWVYDAVKYVYDHKIMTGMRPDYFGVSETLSRAQFATILYRIAGEPSIVTKQVFPDVPITEETKWYAAAVAWANENKIILGYLNGNFGPADPITREQLAVLLYRYAKYMKYDTSEKADFSNYPDAKDVSPWAVEAMQWAVGNGILTGEGGKYLNPVGLSDRAKCAAMVERFMEKFVDA